MFEGMIMDTYQQVNHFLETCFRVMEKDAPTPTEIVLDNRKAVRYSSQNLEIAILQKLARYISGLNSSLILLSYGYTQEVGVLFRTLDEFQEDIFFLGIPLNGGERSPTHERYLKNFYQEEYDNADSPFLSSQLRELIPRRVIQAALANEGKGSLNPSDSKENMRTLSKAYSGFVHGTSVHILDMINPANLKYMLHGMPRTQRQNEFICNYWNYSYRGIVLMMYVSHTFGYPDIYNECVKFREFFEKTTGDSGQGDAEKLVRKMKSKPKL